MVIDKTVIDKTGSAAAATASLRASFLKATMGLH
jgi:hypothetical protein